jgi:hypothetical protein
MRKRNNQKAAKKSHLFTAFISQSFLFFPYSEMYPSLTSVGSRSRWYLNKQTAQEVADEITDMEEKLAEKRQNDIQVGITIQIRGHAALPIKVTGVVDKDEEDDEEIIVAGQLRETVEEDMVEEEPQDLDDEYMPPRVDSNDLYTTLHTPTMDMYDGPVSPPYYGIFGNPDLP